MSNALTNGKFEDFDDLINSRQELMNQVDEYKVKNPDYNYSLIEKKLLEDIIRMNKDFEPELENHMDEIRLALAQIRTTKEATKKYQPYVKQMNGAFIDKKN